MAKSQGGSQGHMLLATGSRVSVLLSFAIKLMKTKEKQMILKDRRDGVAASLVVLAGAILWSQAPAAAQSNYQATNLVSNQAGKARHQDTQLVNAWGIAFAPTGPFWVSDNGTGLSTVYNGMGVKQSTVVTIPTATGVGLGSPTGMVFNSTTDFVVSQNGKSGAAAFIFDTEDGTISGWNFAVN